MRTIILALLTAAVAAPRGAQDRDSFDSRLVALAQDRDDDLMLRVLKDELDRSVKRLKMDKAAAPYYVEYAVKETTSFEVRATLGAIAGKGEGRVRRLALDVRVGDYGLDNTNFASGGFNFNFPGFGGGGGRGGSLTVDDDYDALRHAIWLETDEAYKAAVEELEKKKAYLQENIVKDRPDDLSREEPFVQIGALAKLELDRERWAQAARALSGVLREYPAVQNSAVMFIAEAENRWFINSEGFRNRGGAVEIGLVAMAMAQADDGMRVSDYEVFAGRAEKDLPQAGAMEKAVRDMAERLTQLTKAPPAEEYRGPVLFEGQAAGEFFAQILAPHLGNAHEPVGRQEGLMAAGGNQLKDKLGQRVLPGFITVVDDPTARDFGGRSILGGWEVDEDGVRAQKITLVEKGILKTFCMSRIPTRHVKRSNGHSRGGTGATSTLLVESESKVAAKDLRAQLLELGREEGLKHVLVVRRGSNLLAGAMNPSGMMSVMMGAMGGGGVVLMPPVLLYRVNVEDGTEQLVRGAKFGRLTLRVLRDIVATGDAPEAHPTVRSTQSVSFIVAPSVLVKEMEVNKPGQETEKPPVMRNPLFEK